MNAEHRTSKDESWQETAKRLGGAHATWLVGLLSPIVEQIAREEFQHGYKHGFEDGEKANGKRKDIDTYGKGRACPENCGND